MQEERIKEKKTNSGSSIIRIYIYIHIYIIIYTVLYTIGLSSFSQ